MRLIIGLILLAFPIAEIFLLIALSQRYGWWLLLYLVVVTYLGLQLIRGEKQLMTVKMMQSLSHGGNPVKTMLGSARNLVAGVLLIIPGVMSDIIAAILLLIPIQQPKINEMGSVGSQTNYESTYKKSNKPAANDDVIEGEFVEIIEDPKNQ
jgi:UPF0716 protein FxsA